MQQSRKTDRIRMSGAKDAYDFLFERNFQAAAAYFQIHGDLECRKDYVDSQGIKLGAWLNDLRQQYKKRGRALLSEEQFRMLDDIGMRWDGKYDKQWNEMLRVLTAYIERTNSTAVPATWKENGVKLGRWLRQQKSLYMSGQLRADRAGKLRELGVDLVITDPWEMKFELAKAYSEAHGGQLNVPSDYVVNGVWLSKWLNDQKLIGEGRRKKQLTPEQRRKLESIGMVFGTTSQERVWEQHYQAVRSFVEQSGTTAVPKGLSDTDGVKLQLWVKRQLAYARQGRLSETKADKLRQIGFVPEKNTGKTIARSSAGKKNAV